MLAACAVNGAGLSSDDLEPFRVGRAWRRGIKRITPLMTVSMKRPISFVVSHHESPMETKPQPRSLRSWRCQAGIERAKRKGTVFGRPMVLDAGQRKKIAERYAKGETVAELARDYDCGVATIWRALR
jgi:hypothetical protein